MNGRWWTTAVAIPAAMLGALVVIPLSFAGDLPDPLAVHWGPGGAPNGSLAKWGLVAVVAALFTLIWLVSLAAHRGGTLLAPVAAVLYFLGGMLIAVMVTTLLANRGAASWTDASHIGLGSVALVIGIGLVGGVIGWVLAGGHDNVFPVTEQESHLPTIDLDADDVGVWTSAGVSLWVPILGLAGVVAALVLQGGTGILLGIVGLVLLAVAAVQVVVGPEGITIGLGWWGWPRRQIPFDEIARAEVLHVEPLSYGGWGYRIVASRVLTNARAIVVRRGPGIRLVREDRPDLIVTVDDAERGAGLINELLRRRGTLHVV